MNRNRIRELREEKRITQVRLSIELEVSQENISAYESGKYYPSAGILIKLREIFGESIDYILGLTDTRYEPIQMNQLREEEYAVLHMYRRLDEPGRARMMAYMDGYLEGIRQAKKKEAEGK